MAYFGEVAVSYNNMLFLTYTHRFEASSIFAAARTGTITIPAPA
jgi:hypothetical protein